MWSSRPLWRHAPGARGALALATVALALRLPIFPSVTLTRSFGSGGDHIDWGYQLGTLAHHLRYEPSWASHRLGQAIALSALHPLLLVILAATLATWAPQLARRWSRRARLVVEVLCRRAATFAYGVFGLILGLQTLLHFRIVPGPRRLLFAGLSVAIVGLLILALRGRERWTPRSLGRKALRLVGVLALGPPLLAALLVVWRTIDDARSPHVRWTWAITIVVVVTLRAVVAARSRGRDRRPSPS